MTIRRKVLFSLGISLIALLAAVLFAGRKLRLVEVLAREENSVRSDIRRFGNVLHAEFTHFDRDTNTDAFRTSAAMILSPGAEATSLETLGTASIFIIHNADIIGFVSPEGRVIRARQFDRGSGREIPLPQDFEDRLRAGDSLSRSLASSESSACILAFNETPYLLVSHPAAVSLRPDSKEGALVIARKFDDEFLEKIIRVSNLPLKILPKDKAGVPADVRAILDAGPARKTAVYLPAEDSIAGVIQAKDPEGRPVIAFSFEKPRDFYEQFTRNWRTFAGLMIALSLFSLLLSGILVEKLAIARLSKLAAFVKSVDTNTDTPARVPVEGGDEISGLAVSINGMLESLHTYNLERRDLIQRLESDSLEDALTGLYNRRGFLTIGREYLNLSARNKHRMHLLFLDMDNLKQINDTFGHAVGDEAIVRSAEIIKTVFRGSDIKSRLGGDEFAVFPISATPEGLKAALSRFHEKTAEFNRSGVCPFILSFSSGVAGFDPNDPATIDDLLARADKRMYEEKRRKSNGFTRA